MINSDIENVTSTTICYYESEITGTKTRLAETTERYELKGLYKASSSSVPRL